MMFILLYDIKPSIKKALEIIKKSNPSELVVLPLFHYASATSGSVFEDLTKKISKECGYSFFQIYITIL